MLFNRNKAKTFTVEASKRVDNGIGGFTDTWITEKQIKGFIDLINGVENTSTNALIEHSTHILITDYVKDITNKHRVVDDVGNIYDITSIDDPVGLNHHLEIYLSLNR